MILVLAQKSSERKERGGRARNVLEAEVRVTGLLTLKMDWARGGDARTHAGTQARRHAGTHARTLAWRIWQNFQRNSACAHPPVKQPEL